MRLLMMSLPREHSPEDRFCMSRKGGTWGGGWVQPKCNNGASPKPWAACGAHPLGAERATFCVFSMNDWSLQSPLFSTVSTGLLQLVSTAWSWLVSYSLTGLDWYLTVSTGFHWSLTVSTGFLQSQLVSYSLHWSLTVSIGLLQSPLVSCSFLQSLTVSTGLLQSRLVSYNLH